MAFDIPREECGGGRGRGREDDGPGVMRDLRAGAGDLDSEVPHSPDVIPSTGWGIMLPANEGGEVGMPMGVVVSMSMASEPAAGTSAAAGRGTTILGEPEES